jgi:hypothetical protein
VSAKRQRLELLATPAATAPLASDHLCTQAEAAYFLGVSTRYLRESSCPKVLLPGTGEKGQPVVRYDPSAVREWAAKWSTTKHTERIA